MSHFKLHALSAAVISSLIAAPLVSHAQSAVGSTDLGVTEEIIVVGFKRSLVDALSVKRNSSNITDGISAEDIGKSADQNIAEALQRVTGISIDRANGEGTTVVVRGTSGNLNNVTLNGVTLTSTSGDIANNQGNQAVDFSAYTSDILSQIEVVKTPSADQDEGSLGAAINLRSFKPLSLNKNRRIFEVQSRYNDFENGSNFELNDLVDGDSRINLSLSQKLFDDTLGVSLVLTSETNSGRTDDYLISRYYAVESGESFDDGAVSLPGGFTNLETGNIDQNVRVHAPFEIQYAQNYFETKRNTISSTIEFRPTDNTDVQFDVTYITLDNDRSSSRFGTRPNGSFQEGANTVYDPETFTLVKWTRTAFDVTDNNLANPGFFRSEQNINETTEKNLVFGFDVEHEQGDFTFNLKGGRSKSTSRDDKFLTADAQIENQALQGAANVFPNSLNGLDGRSGFQQGFDCSLSSSSACPIFASETIPNRIRPGDPDRPGASQAIVDDLFEFNFGSIALRDRSIEDVSESVFFDVDWDNEFGPISSIESGLKWSSRNKLQRQTNRSLNRFSFGPDYRNRSVEEYLVPGAVAFRDGFGSELGLPRDALTDGIPVFDPQAIISDLNALDIAALQAVDPSISGPVVRSNLGNLRDIKNTVYGAYLKANFEFLDGDLEGDFGIRYAKTDVDVSGGSAINLRPANFVNDPDNLAFFGWNGVRDDPSEETARLASLAYFGIDISNPGNPDLQLPATPISDSHSYDNVLPSLNLNYSFNDDMIVRFALSRTMARPPIDDTRANFSFTEREFAPFSSVRSGNTQLNPFISDNIDVSFEWYFTEGSLFSAALFNKDLSDFVRDTSESFYIRDPRDIFYNPDGSPITDRNEFGVAIGEPGFVADQFTLLRPFDTNDQPVDCLPNRELNLDGGQVGPLGCDQVEFTQPKNGQSAYVRGLELSVQHNLDYLPGLLGGLGFVANYTYSDSETEEERDGDGNILFRAAPLPQTSLHTFNATVFYEKNGKLLRLAYNTRSDFLITSAPITGGYHNYGEGGESLDLSGAWDVNDKLTLNVQAVNILDDVTRRYAVNERDDAPEGSTALPSEALSLGDAPTGRTQFLQNSGTIYRVGLRYSF